VVLVLLLIDVGVRVMNFRSRLPALVALIALALPRLAIAQMPDTGLAERVAEVVTRHPALGIFDDVIVEATNGAVRLTGRVTTRIKRDAVAERAAKINGVLSVANEIQVLPNSPLDARLRARVAQTIYSHPSFWRYASMANPPIHIIVENGHVTLTGCVNSDGEKALAFALAQVEGAVGVKNELRGEVRRE
jgi:hyperosmotically inducible periplasmic protein